MTSHHPGNKVVAFFKSLRYRNLLMPYLQSVLLAVLIPLAVVSVWFLTHIYNTMAENVRENNLQSTERFCIDFRATLNDMDGLAFKFGNIAAFYPAAYERDNLTSLNTIKHYRNLNHKYDDIMILYKDVGQVLTTHGINELTLFYPGLPGREALIEAILSCTSAAFLNTADYGVDVPQSHLLYVRALPPVNRPKHFVLFVISNETLRANTVLAYNDAQKDIQVIQDASGRVIWASRPISQENAAILLEPGKALDQADRIRFEGQEYFYTRRTISHGLSFVRLAASVEGFDLLHTTLTYFLTCCLMIFLGGAVVMALAVRRGYRPLKQIVDAISEEAGPQEEKGKSELDTLRRALSPGAFLLANPSKGAGHFSMEQLRSLFVLNAIQGRYTSPEELHNIIRNLQLNLTAGYHFVCCILVDVRNQQDMREVVIGRLLSDAPDVHSGSYFYVGLDGRTTVGILSAVTEDAGERIAYGRKLLSGFPDDWNATVAIGHAYQDFSLMSKSYLEARSALDYRFIKGGRSVIAAEDLPEEVNNTAEYPKALIQEFAHKVRAWNTHAITGQLSAILQHIQAHNLPLHQARCVCFDLASIFLKEASEINLRAATSLYEVCDIFSLSEYDSIADLVNTIELLSQRICSFMAENSSRKDSRFVQECMDYLERNLANSQFSLEAMADQMGISPQYLRKRFKELSGHTLSDTLHDLRIARAKELLLHTGEDVGAIIAKIGYVDVSSFIRKFKNATGLPPGKFRDQHKTKYDRRQEHG